MSKELLLPPEDLEQLQSPCMAALHEDLRRGWHAKVTIGLHSQLRLAQTFGELKPLHSEPLGQLVAVVDKTIFHEMRRRFGAHIWRDPVFRRRFFADNPQFRVRSKPRRTTVMMNRQDAKSAKGSELIIPSSRSS